MIADSTLQDLKKIVGSDKVYTHLSERLPYRFGNVVEFRFNAPRFIADCILRPNSAKEVSDTLKLANKEGIAVTVWGGGTDFTGANSPIKGGIVLDMKGLNKIELNMRDKHITAGGGAILLNLTQEAERYNLLFPHELTTQSSATVGGCIATNSFGHRSGGYRSINSLLLSLEVVLPTGEIIKNKPLFRNAMGYDLNSLMVGSEGTLGIITEATFRLLPQPEGREFVFYLFDSLETALMATNDIELLEPDYFDLVELSFLRYSKKKAGFIKAYLKSKMLEDYIHSKYVESSLYGRILEKILENNPLTKQLTKHLELTMSGKGCLSILSLGFEGPKKIVKTKFHLSDKKAKKYSGLKFDDEAYYSKRFGGTLEHIKEMLIHLDEPDVDKNGFSTIDVTIPPSKIMDLINVLHHLSMTHKTIQLIDIDLYSHSTTLGVDLFVPLDDQNEYNDYMAELKGHLLKMGGSLSFAHGVGVRYIADMEIMFSPAYIETMRKLKRSLDPNNILNPGKLGDFDGP